MDKIYTKLDYDILKFCKTQRNISEIETKFNIDNISAQSSLNHLQKYNYVTLGNNYNSVKIQPKGLQAIEVYKVKQNKDRITTLLIILTLLVSSVGAWFSYSNDTYEIIENTSQPIEQQELQLLNSESSLSDTHQTIYKSTKNEIDSNDSL